MFPHISPSFISPSHFQIFCGRLLFKNMPPSCGGGAPHQHTASFSILERGPPKKRAVKSTWLARQRPFYHVSSHPYFCKSKNKNRQRVAVKKRCTFSWCLFPCPFGAILVPPGSPDQPSPHLLRGKRERKRDPKLRQRGGGGESDFAAVGTRSKQLDQKLLE